MNYSIYSFACNVVACVLDVESLEKEFICPLCLLRLVRSLDAQGIVFAYDFLHLVFQGL